MVKSTILLALLSSVFLLTPAAQTGETPEQALDRAALVALYDSTNGAAWWKNDGWLNDTDSEPSHCAWYGVTCAEDGRVLGLALPSNDLSGGLPAEIGNLGRLRKLNLGGNDLHGLIPNDLGKLHDLRELALWGNRLSGPIPVELGDLSNLVFLSLADNQLNGSIPVQLANLSNLRTLKIGCNGLSGRIPGQLGDLSNLEELALGNNQLSGAIPPELGRLSNLRSLCLSGNRLSGEIPAEFSNLTKLESLNLGHNELSGSIPLELDHLTYLGSLRLEGNELNDSGQDAAEDPEEMARTRMELDQLTCLEMTHPGEWKKDIPFDGQATLSGERHCMLSVDSEREALLALYFSTDGDNWVDNSGWLDFTLPYPAHCSWFGVRCNREGKVTRLNLRNNQLRGSIPAALGMLSDLEWLRLNGNRLSGSIPPELGQLSHVRLLWLHCNRLHGSIPGALAGLSNLQSINLSKNRLSGPIPSRLADLQQVEEFKVNNNDLLCWESSAVRQWAKSIDRMDWDHPHPGREICLPPESGSLTATNRLALDRLYQVFQIDR